MSVQSLVPRGFSDDCEELRHASFGSNIGSEPSWSGASDLAMKIASVLPTSEGFSAVVEFLEQQGYQVEFKLTREGHAIKAILQQFPEHLQNHREAFHNIDKLRNPPIPPELPDQDLYEQDGYYDPFSDPYYDGWSEQDILDDLLGDVGDDGIPYGWDPGEHGD